MASNMTTSEKLKHPVAAVKEMMGKGHGHNTTGAHDAHNQHGVLGHHTEHPIRGVTETTPINQTNEEQLNVEAGGLGGTPTLGTTAGTGARPVFSETGTAVDPHDHHKGHHPGAGIGGATATGLGAYEADKHLGQHGQHQTGRHMGTGATGTGVGGVGAYEAEKHLGHHNRHNDAEVLAGQPGLPGTTGTRGEVYTPHDQRPRNVGLNMIGMDTPLNTSDYRSYPAETAQGAPHHPHSNVNEERLEKTSLPANPLMSALTGGKIPPSIHGGVEQAGATNATGGVNTGTGAHGAHHMGAPNRATGAYDTTHAGNRDVI